MIVTCGKCKEECHYYTHSETVFSECCGDDRVFVQSKRGSRKYRLTYDAVKAERKTINQ